LEDLLPETDIVVMVFLEFRVDEFKFYLLFVDIHLLCMERCLQLGYDETIIFVLKADSEEYFKGEE
jgi:hypothetical protein